MARWLRAETACGRSAIARRFFMAIRKSETWSSAGNKISVQIIDRLDGEDGVEFWRNVSNMSQIIPLKKLKR
jgi:hypothetical protein